MNMKGLWYLLQFLSVLTVVSTQAITASRIWTIAVPYNLGGLIYQEDGLLKGLAVDFVDAVCGEADMDCRIVRGGLTDCWNTYPGSRASGGRGLFGHWFDACTNSPTVERFATFKFSISMYKPTPSFIWVLKGRTLDASNLKGRRIGFLTSAVGQCLARNGVDFDHNENNSIPYRLADLRQIISDLQTGKIDGVFSSAIWTAPHLELIEPITERTFYCNLDGPALMSRKDSHFTANWNVGVNKLLNSPKWTKMCNGVDDKHGHKGGLLLPCKE